MKCRAARGFSGRSLFALFFVFIAALFMAPGESSSLRAAEPSQIDGPKVTIHHIVHDSGVYGNVPFVYETQTFTSDDDYVVEQIGSIKHKETLEIPLEKFLENRVILGQAEMPGWSVQASCGAPVPGIQMIQGFTKVLFTLHEDNPDFRNDVTCTFISFNAPWGVIIMKEGAPEAYPEHGDKEFDFFTETYPVGGVAPSSSL